jgi:hypothetical protein
MHRLVCATAAFVLSSAGIISHAQSTSQKESLRELMGVAVTVKVTPEAQRVGLRESQIRTDVEQQIRSAHVPLLGHPRDVLFVGGRRVNTFPPFLSVVVDVTPQRTKAPTYAVEVVVSQDAPDLKDPRAKTSGTTWRIARAGTLNSRSLKEVRRDVKTAVDQFISDYLAVNTK